MLYLVQHGEAEKKEVNPDRPLSTDGKKAVSRLALFMKTAGIGIDHILHSGKTRAKQTAEIFAKSISETGAVKVIAGINPTDPVDGLIAEIHRVNSPTMIVGHLPFMAKLVSKLLTNSEDIDIVEYQPGSVVCLERNDDEHWVVQWMLRPELIKQENC